VVLDLVAVVFIKTAHREALAHFPQSLLLEVDLVLVPQVLEAKPLAELVALAAAAAGAAAFQV
jgi:hypothetical protein